MVVTKSAKYFGSSDRYYGGSLQIDELPSVHKIDRVLLEKYLTVCREKFVAICHSYSLSVILSIVNLALHRISILDSYSKRF